LLTLPFVSAQISLHTLMQIASIKPKSGVGHPHRLYLKRPQIHRANSGSDCLLLFVISSTRTELAEIVPTL